MKILFGTALFVGVFITAIALIVPVILPVIGWTLGRIAEDRVSEQSAARAYAAAVTIYIGCLIALLVVSVFCLPGARE